MNCSLLFKCIEHTLRNPLDRLRVPSRDHKQSCIISVEEHEFHFCGCQKKGIYTFDISINGKYWCTIASEDSGKSSRIANDAQGFKIYRFQPEVTKILGYHLDPSESLAIERILTPSIEDIYFIEKIVHLVQLRAIKFEDSVVTAQMTKVLNRGVHYDMFIRD